MEQKTASLTLKTDGICNPESTILGDHFRFTLLTKRILRLEYAKNGVFEDRPSQVVLNRNFPSPEFSVREKDGVLELDTPLYHLTYQNEKNEPFSPSNLVIQAKNDYTSYGNLWRFGETTYGNPPKCDNLMGTTRTLDRTDGAVPLDLGLMGRNGHAFLDDSGSALLENDGSFSPRNPDTQDVYFFCCGHEYEETLGDFFRISGAPPMLPRYALGNWWSRWWRYTEDSYLTLMDEFKAIGAPFTVSVLDMDWHITTPPKKYGAGWTGFTWNRDFFPDPKRFLGSLHERGLHATLNLHPADGVRAFEDAYPAMAKALGVDTKNEEPIPFDFTKKDFINAYFDHLIRPHEEMGVDFWWMDWQQGTSSSIAGLDPLWLLNHFHVLDNSKNGKRGLLLSRYAGPGSQRYPVGFSGDTAVTWETLAFQPYFTATATNAGFPWWSHDIGGFHFGTREGELFCRWLQLGVFSPIVRLHSNRSEFLEKDPRSFGKEYEETLCFWLRFRHRMIPYLYSETYRQHKEFRPLIRPIYYEYPDEKISYSLPNQYLFGSSLMVCPITDPENSDTKMGSVKAFIPEGVFTDIFSGKTYEGPRFVTLNRPVDQMPVLAKPGAILPLAMDKKGDNSVSNPTEMEILVFPGKSGAYTLFEDDGESANFEKGAFFETEFSLDWEKKTFTIQGKGDKSLLPQKRTFTLTFRGFDPFTPEGKGIESASYDPATRSLSVTLSPADPDEDISLDLKGAGRESGKDFVDRCRKFLMLCRYPTTKKAALMSTISSGKAPHLILEEMMTLDTPTEILSVLTELIIS